MTHAFATCIRVTTRVRNELGRVEPTRLIPHRVISELGQEKNVTYIYIYITKGLKCSPITHVSCRANPLKSLTFYLFD